MTSLETHQWEHHGRLRVSANGHYLEFEDGVGFFWLGDTAWRLPRLTAEQIDHYLANRASKGFNVIQFAVGSNSVTPSGERPFIGEGPPWPAVEPNEAYWRHIDLIVERVKVHGMYAAIFTLWGPAADSPDDRSAQLFTDPDKHNEAYGRFLGARYRAEPHIIWVVSGEYHKPFMFPPLAEETLARLRRLATGLRAGDGDAHLCTIHALSRYTSSEEFHDDDWLDFNMAQSHVYHDLIEPLIAGDWQRTPAKPTVNGEGWYEAEEELFERKEGIVKVRPYAIDRTSYDTAWIQRYQAYWSTFFGGIGYSYGHMNLWTMTDLYQLYTLTTDWPTALLQSALDAPGSATLRYLRQLVESKPIQTRVPDQALVTTNTRGSGGTLSPDLRCATRDQNGRWAMIYSTKGLVIRVVMHRLAAGRAAACWYNPRTGQWRVGEADSPDQRPFETGIAAGPGAPDRYFFPPNAPSGPGRHDRYSYTGGVGEGVDWVLLLDVEPLAGP